MHMVHFDCDYMEGAHPEILKRLADTNFEQTPGYGEDSYTAKAKELILKACGLENARVMFLVGGTQTNSTVIDGILDRHEGVLCAESGHINVHESGAIEASGHKVLVLPQHDGKIRAGDLASYIDDFYKDDTFGHMVAPGMAYISHPTEYGTLYSLNELEAISKACKEKGIPLYIDGARLGYGIMADGTDVTLNDIARLSDVFYIGGTKVGALFGEAVVITNDRILKHFFPLVKQHGALLAKGRVLGLQFQTLFADGLYFRIARHAVEMAGKLKSAMLSKGYRQVIDSPTNLQFFRIPNSEIDRLKRFATFEYWGPRGKQESTVRFATSWATKEEDIDEFISKL